jgi:hypothetical protein
MLIWLVIFMNAALSGLQFFRAILTTFCCAWVLEMIKINTSRKETHRFIARVGDGEADILLRRRTIWVGALSSCHHRASGNWKDSVQIWRLRLKKGKASTKVK